MRSGPCEIPGALHDIHRSTVSAEIAGQSGMLLMRFDLAQLGLCLLPQPLTHGRRSEQCQHCAQAGGLRPEGASGCGCRSHDAGRGPQRFGTAGRCGPGIPAGMQHGRGTADCLPASVCSKGTPLHAPVNVLSRVTGCQSMPPVLLCNMEPNGDSLHAACESRCGASLPADILRDICTSPTCPDTAVQC